MTTNEISNIISYVGALGADINWFLGTIALMLAMTVIFCLVFEAMQDSLQAWLYSQEEVEEKLSWEQAYDEAMTIDEEQEAAWATGLGLMEDAEARYSFWVKTWADTRTLDREIDQLEVDFHTKICIEANNLNNAIDHQAKNIEVAMAKIMADEQMAAPVRFMRVGAQVLKVETGAPPVRHVA